MLALMSYVMLMTGLVVFLILFLLPAPYGRYSSRSWGFLIDARLSWFIQELPALLIPVLLLIVKLSGSDNDLPITNYILLGCFLLHYSHRVLIYPLVAIISGKANPVSVIMFAFVFCLYNGYLQGMHLLNGDTYPADWLVHYTSITGLLLFFTGMFININSDYALSRLRSQRKPSDDTQYFIPQGGLFQYVSCANYFGEILEWIGYALVGWSLPTTSFAIFTFCNLAPRALTHHRWYQQKFDNYPKTRNALIPFLL